MPQHPGKTKSAKAISRKVPKKIRKRATGRKR